MMRKTCGWHVAFVTVSNTPKLTPLTRKQGVKLVFSIHENKFGRNILNLVRKNRNNRQNRLRTGNRDCSKTKQHSFGKNAKTLG